MGLNADVPRGQRPGGAARFPRSEKGKGGQIGAILPATRAASPSLSSACHLNLPVRRAAAIFDSVDALPPPFPDSNAIRRLSPVSLVAA